MSDLTIVSFADKPLDEHNYLKKSCEEYDINLEVLLSSPWIQNVIKLKLLSDYVANQNPEQILLMVDAYDVVVYGNAQEIKRKFEAQKVDILFSGESNFMYKEPAKWFEFLRKYPRQNSIYQYLNSGSYIGRAKHIKLMLEKIQEWFSIDFNEQEELLKLKSDQYLLHRFYVENFYDSKSKLKLNIDFKQELLGCTGGRFCVLKMPDINKWQAFTFFIFERNLLKLFNLHRYQKISKDFTFEKDQFYNSKTEQFSTVMHFPGTWDRFGKVLNELSNAEVKPTLELGWFLAATVSFSSYLLSILAAPIFWIATRRNN